MADILCEKVKQLLLMWEVAQLDFHCTWAIVVSYYIRFCSQFAFYISPQITVIVGLFLWAILYNYIKGLHTDSVIVSCDYLLFVVIQILNLCEYIHISYKNFMDRRISNDDVERYSRQLIMPEIGMQGQLKLKSSKVVIIGAGGLGCPCAQYLVAAGIGTLGILDHDTAEKSNLHRQVLHTEVGVSQGILKAESVAQRLRLLNSTCNILPICEMLTRDNASEIFKNYDLVVDATDNVASRYLISDVCVLTDKPLVSGSALKWEGQLTTYHYTSKQGTTGPCYRCLYPMPPPPTTVTNCSDGGVIGVVPGIIGCMQALETIKVLTGNEPSFHQKLFIFDGLRGVSKTVALRPRQKHCVCCGQNPTINLTELPDYAAFCGMGATDKCRVLNILDKQERISVSELRDFISSAAKHVLIDVRNPVELDICALPNSVNIPLHRLRAARVKIESGKSISPENFGEIFALQNRITELLLELGNNSDNTCNVFVVCRMGNDSQVAVTIFKDLFKHYENVTFKDARGGLMAWANEIDKDMAKY